MVLPGYVVPGQLIISSNDADFSKYVIGSGTESTERGITATILGKLNAIEEDSKPKKWQLVITNEFRNPYAQLPSNPSGNSKRSNSQLPQVGDNVYARVLRLGAQQVHVEIIAVENKGNTSTDNGVGQFASSVGSVHVNGGGSSGDKAELGEGYGAVIRTQDIRATEREKIKLPEQFLPGDLIRASVLSLGDENNYYLSTTRNDLGVVFAKNPKTNAQLLPMDWQHMIDPTNGTTHARKCANPFV